MTAPLDQAGMRKRHRTYGETPSLANLRRDLRRGHGMTPRQMEILAVMAAHEDEDAGELVYERGCAYLGDERVAARTVFALLRLMAISRVEGRVGGVERYQINDTGRALLAGATEGT